MMNIISKIRERLRNTAAHNIPSHQSTYSPEQAAVLKLFGIHTAIDASEEKLSAERISELLGELAGSDFMDEKTVLEFDDKIFSLKYISHPERTPGHANLNSLPEIFCKNEKYMQILQANKRSHSPERARLKAILDHTADTEAALQEMSASFNRITKSCNDSKYLNIVWVKYLNLSGRYTDKVPQALLAYITKETYRSVSSLCKSYTERTDVYAGKNEKHNRDCQVRLVCEYILKNVEPADVPSLLLLGKFYQKNGDYRKAETYFRKLIIGSNSFNGVTALANCYEEEISSIKSQSRKSGNGRQIWSEIQHINTNLENLYESNLRILAAKIESDDADVISKKNYVSLACKYARLEKSIGSFEHCKEILDEIPASYPEYHRVLLEYGLLCQHHGKERWPNAYYNLNRAAAYFEQAAMLTDCEDLSKADLCRTKKSVLMPLANTYFMLGKLDMATDICNKTLRLDSKERNAINLMERIQKEEVTEISA